MIFVDACYCRKTERPPVWFMRQAGRYLPEFREIRKKTEFLELCRTPELVTEVTMQPIRRFDCDAAIIFSDILVPFTPMGLDLAYEKGEGPVIRNPIRTLADVEALRIPNFQTDLGYVGDALRQTRNALSPEKALIGFVGAPFTLACYAVSGRMGKSTEEMRQWMFANPEAFQLLMDKFTEMLAGYLVYQAESGADALQIFDTWGGSLSAYDFQAYFLERFQTLMRVTADLNVPRILFIKSAAHLRYFLPSIGAEVIGLDWTMPIGHSRRMLGPKTAVQGNLDPASLFADPEWIAERTRAMIEANSGQPGYIANLGHGIHKDTPIPGVAAFVETVKTYQF
ncbi:MAG: uroporphyrinogen decarboxylase [Acidobacteria bacterium]|nr:uroporphyrinogen decarboxylase [Acidobacteriota bacterium]